MVGIVERFIRDRLLAERPSYEVIGDVRRQHFSTAALETAVRSSDPAVRAVLATLNLPRRLLDPLANDPDPAVRRTVASNPATMTDLVKLLVDDRDVSVVSVALAELRARGVKVS